MQRPGSMRSLSPAAYADYRNGKLSRRARAQWPARLPIDKWRSSNKSRLSDDTVRAMLNVRPDKVQTYESLEAGIRRLYALGRSIASPTGGGAGRRERAGGGRQRGRTGGRVI